MKRYMFCNFFIDTVRNILAADLPPNALAREKAEIAQWLSSKYGVKGISEKVGRYLEIRVPSFVVVTEFHDMLREVHDAYVSGYFYPALTGACCIGERIFNILILRLRDHYRALPSYKHVHRRDSFDNWDKAIDTLLKWGVLPAEIETNYRRLARLRHTSVHFNPLSELRLHARDAVHEAMTITDRLFGLRPDFLFIAGHIFIKRGKESDPVVREFYVPSSLRVGYRYDIQNGPEGEMVVVDDNEYEDRDVSDEEFVALREEWQKSLTK